MARARMRRLLLLVWRETRLSACGVGRNGSAVGTAPTPACIIEARLVNETEFRVERQSPYQSLCHVATVTTRRTCDNELARCFFITRLTLQTISREEKIRPICRKVRM